MSNAKETLLRQHGFGCSGAITASLSHEINNVLATINELSGLLGDFFHAANQGAPLNVERLEKTTQRIAGQVQRGRELVKRLNAFAHTTDEGQGAVVLNETVEAMTTLCRRFGQLRQVELETGLPKASPRIEGNAFDLQHLVFRCLQILLDASRPGDVVRIDVEPQDDGARLVFVGSSEKEPATDLESRMDFLALLVAEMHGTVASVIETGRPVRLEVSLPHSLKHRSEKHE